MTGAQLRALRKKLGVTQGLLSEATGILVPNICKMERGHRTISPRTERRLRLAFRRIRSGELHVVSRLAARQARAVLSGRCK